MKIGWMDPTPLSYYTAAEPRLLDLQARFERGEITKDDARAELVTLVGMRRYFSDWEEAQVVPCPPTHDRGMWELRQFQAYAPQFSLRQRLYSGPAGIQYEEVAHLLGLGV